MIAHAGLNHPDQKTIVLADESWHTGVIGIVASRIVDKYYRPTVLINTTESPAQGSTRSIPGFDIFKALTACSEHLIDFGGHTMAAGVRIESKKIPEFTEAFEKYARDNLREEDIVAKLYIDATAPLTEFHRGMVKELKRLEPFGEGNPKPLFATKGVRLASPPRRVGARGDHLQLAITDNNACVRCIGFGMGKLEKKLLEADYFNVAFQPQINNFNGTSNVQFVLEDVQFD